MIRFVIFLMIAMFSSSVFAEQNNQDPNIWTKIEKRYISMDSGIEYDETIVLRCTSADLSKIIIVIYNEDGFEIYREIQQIDSEIDDCILYFDPSMRYGVESFVDEYMGMEVY